MCARVCVRGNGVTDDVCKWNVVGRKPGEVRVRGVAQVLYAIEPGQRGPPFARHTPTGSYFCFYLLFSSLPVFRKHDRCLAQLL